MMKKLAIVIPAYKIDFLRETLRSIYKQTCKDFNLYIGNDCSPYDIETVVKEFDDGSINLVYKRFDTNLGGKDLVAQWTRCISLTKHEEWIWLFSDDDVMSSECVERFYQELNSTSGDFFHFNVTVIDENGDKCKLKEYNKQDFPQYLSQYQYINSRLTFSVNSFVVEYIFKRSLYEKIDGFKYFDLAWGSDDATWILMSKSVDICTIKDARVYWRCSSLNISPARNAIMMYRKLIATIEYIKFLYIDIAYRETNKLFIYWVHIIFSACKILSFKDINNMNNKISSLLDLNFLRRTILYIFSFMSIIYKKS